MIELVLVLVLVLVLESRRVATIGIGTSRLNRHYATTDFLRAKSVG